MALKEKEKALLHMGYTTTWSSDNDLSQKNYRNTTCPILWSVQMRVKCHILKYFFLSYIMQLMFSNTFNSNTQSFFYSMKLDDWMNKIFMCRIVVTKQIFKKKSKNHDILLSVQQRVNLITFNIRILPFQYWNYI